MKIISQLYFVLSFDNDLIRGIKPLINFVANLAQDLNFAVYGWRVKDVCLQKASIKVIFTPAVGLVAEIWPRI